MGTRLFRTLVGVGISLGVTSAGCLGQSRDPGGSAPGAGGGGSGNVGGLAEATSAGMTQGTVTSTTGSPPSSHSETTGSTSGGGTGGSGTGGSGTGGVDAGANGDSNETGGSDASGNGDTNTSSASDGAGFGGSGGAGPGAGGQGGDGSDPFCDTTWPTTKGNPPIPECVDPDHECEDELPLRCLVPTGAFACDGHFERHYAPLCVDGSWECEPGLVPVTECRCFTPLPTDHTCTPDGPVPLDGEHP